MFAVEQICNSSQDHSLIPAFCKPFTVHCYFVLLLIGLHLSSFTLSKALKKQNTPPVFSRHLLLSLFSGTRRSCFLLSFPSVMQTEVSEKSSENTLKYVLRCQNSFLMQWLPHVFSQASTENRKAKRNILNYLFFIFPPDKVQIPFEQGLIARIWTYRD